MPYCSNPTDTPKLWMVWDVRVGLIQKKPRKIVFFGSMEDCGLVADALNQDAR